MRPFTDVLRDMRNGKVVAAITEQLSEVVRAVGFTGKPGELLLTIKVKPQGQNDNLVIVSAAVKTKSPRPDMPDAMFYFDAEGDLLREDPTHVRMFAAAPDAAGEEVDPLTGEVRPIRAN